MAERLGDDRRLFCNLQGADRFFQAGKPRNAAVEQALAELHDLQRLAAALQVCICCKGFNISVQSWFVRRLSLGRSLVLAAHQPCGIQSWFQKTDTFTEGLCLGGRSMYRASTAVYRADFGNAGSRARGEAAAAVGR